MMRPRWRKVWHDLINNMSRTLLVVFSIAVGVFSIGVIVGAYIIISKDMSASYASNNPMNLDLRTGPFDDTLVSTIQNTHGVKDAEGRNVFTVRARMKGAEKWVTLNVIAIEDYSKMNINLLRIDSGTNSPKDKQAVLDRKVQQDMQVKVGQTLELQLENGTIKELPVVGLVQDASTAAGDFLANPFVYITINTLPYLNQAPVYNRLYVTMTDQNNNDTHLQSMLTTVRDKVEKSGVSVFRSRFAKTNEHPMASTVQAILGILLALGVLILFLSSSLIANTLNALLNQHLRYIGIMKLVGASRNQVLQMYMVLIFSFCLIALAIAVPLGGQGAYALSSYIADKINFALMGYRIVPLALMIQIIVGLAVPLLAGFVPVLNGSKISVVRALSDNQMLEESKPVHVEAKKETLIEKVSLRFSKVLSKQNIHIPRPMLISLRNTFRRKGRLILTLFTLTMAGAIFIAVFNVRVTLHDYVNSIGQYFLADVTLDFDQPYRLNEIITKVKAISGVTAVEGWAYASAEAINPDDTLAENLTILAPPSDSKMVAPNLLAGRWLIPGDQKALAVSEQIYLSFPNIKPGDQLYIKINGKKEYWTVVGIFKFVPQEGTIAYGTYEYIAKVTHQNNQAFSYRIMLDKHDKAYQNLMSTKIDTFFHGSGYHINQVRTGDSTLKSASESLDILITFLLIMAILTAIVGSMGLAGTMGMNVLERTREIGVMRSIGAVDRAIMQTVIVEGMAIGGISWVLGAILSIPITYGLSDIVSLAVFQSPITVIFTFTGFLIWFLVVLVLSALASLLPARNAANLTIREVLAYE
ncbi:MAG: FtsX-like permease family protein [Chloroflexi bacterium]|nr:FtsX-like permease family protein [Chloroflexota bacterium]